MAFTPTTTLQRRRLVDELIDAYVDWRERCVAVSESYARWAAAKAAEAAHAFEAYAAALDGEESASLIYAALVHRVGDLVATERQSETDVAAAGAARR